VKELFPTEKLFPQYLKNNCLGVCIENRIENLEKEAVTVKADIDNLQKENAKDKVEVNTKKFQHYLDYALVSHLFFLFLCLLLNLICTFPMGRLFPL